MRASLPHVWDLSSPIRDGTCISCVAKWILNHWLLLSLFVDEDMGGSQHGGVHELVFLCCMAMGRC